MGGSSSITRMRMARALMRRRPMSRRPSATGRVMVNTAPGRSDAVAGRDGAAHGLDEAARDRQAQARCRRAPDRPSAPDRTCRRCAPDRRAGCRRPRPGSAGDTDPSLAPALNADRRARRRIFGGVVQKVEQDLLEQHRIDVAPSADRRARSSSTRWRARILLGALKRAADDFAEIVQTRRSARSRRIRAWSCRADWR